LKKRTSINSNFRFHKEKEMADFRRCFYALALVALLAGLTVSASAQAFQCTNSTGVPPLVRAEGYSELMGDLVLDCIGGIPTPPNQSVPQVSIAVNLDVNVTSQTTAVLNQVEFLESLLMVDEPNSPANPARPILNCGNTNAPDNTQAGAGVCSIIGGGSNGAAATYSGLAGHPNVFQGRSFRLITGQYNQVVFAGIPIDPPGTVCPNPVNGQCHRIIRITNIRGDATAKSVVVANVTQTVTAELIINPSSGLPVDNPDHEIARVQLGLIGPALNAPNVGFIQCSSLAAQSQGLVYTFQEGFNEAFKPQSLTQVLLNGAAKPSYNYINGLTPVTTQGVLNNQNVPGAVYDTESGFTNALPAANGDVPTNALTGGPPTGGPGNGAPFTNAGGSATNLVAAGIATQGTRLFLSFSSIPAGSSVSVPIVVNLTNVIGGGVTGVAVLITGTSSTGFGGTPAAVTNPTPCQVTVPATVGCANVAGTVGGITAPGFAVYEVFFSNPAALEKVSIPLLVSGTPNLPSNLPAPGVTAMIQGSFAPFYQPLDNVRRTAFAAGTENTVLIPNTLAIPRFLQIAPAVPLFQINRCSCNLLFPYVTNAATAGGSFDTGIAIANTSLDPGNIAPGFFGFKGSAQSGPVQLWFYNRNATPPAEPNFLGQTNTQCTNVTTPGSCTGTLSNVPPGGVLTYTLFNGGAINGATPSGSVLLPATGFTGYVIAQARFQYCHGFAFISKQGAGFEADNLAMGYLAIVLDAGGLARTSSIGENDAH
jgi:hypothetical protein